MKNIFWEIFLDFLKLSISLCHFRLSHENKRIIVKRKVNKEDLLQDQVKLRKKFSRDDSEKSSFICHVCNRTYSNRKQLDRHNIFIHSDEYLSCNTCGKKFQHKSTLLKHMISHSNEKPFECSFCKRKFKTSDQMKKHDRIVHQGKKPHIYKKYKCNLCPKKYTSLAALEDHQHVHTGQKNHVCHVCCATFVCRRNLIVHIRMVHEGHKKIQVLRQCDQCGKSFGGTRSLNLHMEYIHGDGKPKCHICSKKFSSKQFLVTHLNSHSGIKPFSCKYCERSFAAKKTLIIHTRSHTGESPYSCSNCSKTFKQRSALTQHLKSKHPG